MADLGAPREAWHHWAERLGLHEHLLPVVANPAAPISAGSAIRMLGKTPSRYNFRREVSGFAKWTEHHATMREIGQWEIEPDYGICVQARAVRAIDIDVPHKTKARLILQAIEKALPLHFFPERHREGTGKLLLPFLFKGEMPKRVIPVDGGVIEFLGDGQQWVAESSYIEKGKVNGRYLWRGGWPSDFPELDEADIEVLWAVLVEMFATGEPMIARAKRARLTADDSPRPGLEDPVAQFLLAEWEVRDEGRDGEIFIRCPFDDEHTSFSGPSETVYYVAGTRGYQQGHFKCLHAHCMGRTDDEFEHACGYTASTFPVVEEEPAAEPGTAIEVVEEQEPEVRFITDGKGRIEANTYNFVQFLTHPHLAGRHIAYDDFTAQIVWAPQGEPDNWRAWRDSDYASVAMRMDNRGFKSLQPATLRPAVIKAAELRATDLALQWAERLPAWDGVERIERFLPDYLKTDDDEYHRSVGRYIWTAHAGRLLVPGIKADMATIWQGPQGQYKSAALLAMSPVSSMFLELKVGHRDADTPRLMRGVLVVEMSEMSRVRNIDDEDFKTFITKQVETWVPKYQEFSTSFKRRAILHGTCNPEDILKDPTGSRRFLPFRVCGAGDAGTMIDLDRIAADRDQLWAEGIAKFKAGGIDWREAETLAKDEHVKFSSADAWGPAVTRWLLEEDPMTGKVPVDNPYTWGTTDVLVGAIGKRLAQVTPGDQARVGAVLVALGALRKRRRGMAGWVYRVERDWLYVEEDEDEVDPFS